ncbi:uncharacterized protein LOC113950978 [Corapipo altera]|uniref:uncharacterized protein LOC113950978 n=1 Tax=Corapipo altera TaxID=415028 RepID=UPI000FD63459|nr:uncharacterized protein LOC113950978 [Corapipo altera]
MAADPCQQQRRRWRQQHQRCQALCGIQQRRRGHGPGREGGRRGEPSPAALGGGRGAFDGGRLPQPQLSARIAAASSARPPSLSRLVRRPLRAPPKSRASRATSRRCRSFSAILARSRPLSSSAQANMAPAEPSEGTRQGRHGPSAAAAAATAPSPGASHAAAPRGTMGLVGGRAPIAAGAGPPPLRGAPSRLAGRAPRPSPRSLSVGGAALRGLRGSGDGSPRRAAGTPRPPRKSAFSQGRCSFLGGVHGCALRSPLFPQRFLTKRTSPSTL